MSDWSKNTGGRNNSTFSTNSNQNYNYGSPFASPQTNQRNQFYNSVGYNNLTQIPRSGPTPPKSQHLLPPSFQDSMNSQDPPNGPDLNKEDDDKSETDIGVSDRYSYYMSSQPLFCSDWNTLVDYDTECIALSSFKEGFSNKLHILHGIKYGKEATMPYEEQDYNKDVSPTRMSFDQESIEGFDFHKVTELEVDYPITNLQWDPQMGKGNVLKERLAASSEVLRLYEVDHENYEANGDYKLVQTYHLTNNTSNGKNSNFNSNLNPGNNSDIMTCPPVTSFDWNKVDNSVIITSSVDTTCTVWDLNRSIPFTDSKGDKVDSASVKTQLIAHDSEVFDVKFLNDSTNLFASVGNDGSMRVFDLRSLEHSTIIYEPSNAPPSSTSIKTVNTSAYNSKALIKLDTSNVDQHYLATIGVNSNQIIIIDTRMPGMPISILDGSFDGLANSAINSIRWHPNSNFLLSGGDDCQSLIWDCNSLYQLANTSNKHAAGNIEQSLIINTPVLAYEDTLEVNNVCWRGNQGDWMGVVSGKGFQAISI